MNLWTKCPTERPEVLQVFQNISYKNEIKNWLSKCLKETKSKQYVHYQIEAYFQTVLKITNQDIYKNMSTEINQKITENLDNFKTAEQISTNYNTLKTSNLNKFNEEMLAVKIQGSIPYEGSTVIQYKVGFDNEDFIFLGFNLYDTNNQIHQHIKNQNLKDKLNSVFGGNQNDSYVGWINTINQNNNEEIFNLCKNYDSVVYEMKQKFENAVEKIKEILAN